MSRVVIKWKSGASDLVRKLQEIADPLPYVAIFGLAGNRPLLVAVNRNRVRIRLRPGFGGNDFAPVLQGTITEDEGVNGAVIVGSFGIDRHVRIFIRLWMAGVAAFGLLAFLNSHGNPAWLLLPIGMLVIGYAGPRVAARLSRSDEAEIVALLKAGLGGDTVSVDDTA